MTDWREIYRRFDPERPADRPDWRVERSYSPVRKIVDRLEFDEGPCRVLLTGTVGCGKTTELLRLVESRRDSEFVVFIDVDQHFARVLSDPAALGAVRAWEVIFLVGLQLLRDVRDRLGTVFSLDTEQALASAWQRLAEASSTPDVPAKVDLGPLSKMMITVGAGAASALGGPVAGAAVSALKDAATSRWNLPLGRSRKDLPDQEEQTQSLLAVVNRMLGEVQHAHRRVLLVIDGLDKIHEVARAKALFVESTLIGQLACSTVVCGPFSLRHHPALSSVRGFAPVILVNEPVLTPRGADTRGPGAEVLMQLFDKRIAGVADTSIVPRELLSRLAWASGGRGRDFVRLVQDLARTCALAKVPAAGAAQIDAVVDDARRLIEVGMHAGHQALLREVMARPTVLPAGELAWELLENNHLLPYPNESEWYFPHTLLTLSFLK